MNTPNLRARATRALSVALVAASAACTPLQVVTHTVTQDEMQVPPGQYMLDAHHWSVVFDVEHLKYSRFTMRFDRTHATLDWKGHALEAASVDATIDAASVDTNVPALDRMIRSDRMLDTARYPAIRFVSTGFERTGPASGTLRGNLTIRDVTQPVSLAVTFNGYGVDPLTHKDTLGFSADGRFSRAKFGLATWYPAVGDGVHVRIQAEFARR
jgi:polyisoprenoid-binding protein YceI